MTQYSIKILFVNLVYRVCGGGGGALPTVPF